jgi:hypothetical protein
MAQLAPCQNACKLPANCHHAAPHGVRGLRFHCSVEPLEARLLELVHWSSFCFAGLGVDGVLDFGPTVEQRSLVVLAPPARQSPTVPKAERSRLAEGAIAIRPVLGLQACCTDAYFALVDCIRTAKGIHRAT